MCALGSLKQKEFIPQFWSPELQNQDVSRTTLPPKALGSTYSLLCPAAGGYGHSLICNHIIPVPASVFTGLSSLLCNFTFTGTFVIGFGT